MRSLTKLALALLLLAPSLSLATEPPPPTPKLPSHMKPNAHLGEEVPTTFSEKLHAKYNKHICAPDGCPTPLGCGNWYTEFKFAFGSCRQFFGTGEATKGVANHARVP